MARSWWVVQHVPFETPGLLHAAAAAAGLVLRTCRTWQGDPLPAPDDVAGLVVLGGPMGALDDADHPYLPRERELVRVLVNDGVPVLGICLGAQIVAVAAGATLVPGVAPEVGVGVVTVTDEGGSDPVFKIAGPELPVVQWHTDTFDLPSGALRLASTPACANQAFRHGSAYGLQFHVEVDEGWLAAARPHLPAGVEIGSSDVEAIGRRGSELLGTWFRSSA